MRESVRVLPELTEKINRAGKVSIITNLKYRMRRAVTRRFLLPGITILRRALPAALALLLAVSLSLSPGLVGTLSPAHADAPKVAWPVDVTNGPWKITNGYYGDGSDHGCKNIGQTDLNCPLAYQLFGLDIARSDDAALTNGTPIVSPVNGKVAHHWASNGAGDCIIIAIDGYPINAIDSFSDRRVSLCHVDIGPNARDGATVQQGVTSIGVIATSDSNQHLHFSIYDLDQYKSDDGSNWQYRTPVPFNSDMQIAGCGAYNPNGVLNWPAKTYTGTAQFTGDAITCPSGPGKPGGWWLGPTPKDGAKALVDQLSLPVNVHGQDKTGSGLSKIDITWQLPEGNGQWSKQTKSLPFTPPLTFDTDYSYNIPSPPTGWPSSIIISFDVYSNNQLVTLSPQGMRRICRSDASTCNPVTTNQPGGGSSSCTTPPSTSSSASGNIAGNHGWWRSPVTLTLSATAPCGASGLQTYYSINGGSQTTYATPIAFNQEGIYNVNYYSVDGLGNTEGMRTAQVEIDWTPPGTAGTATGPRDTNGIFRDNVTIGLNGTDNLSGVDYQEYSLDGGASWISMGGNNNTFAITGNGVTRAQYRSTDIAGNIETAKDSGPIIINKYVMFGNGTGQSVRFTGGTTVNVSGDIFSNGTIYVHGNTGSTLGSTITTVGTNNVVDSSNTNTTVAPIASGAASVPMLSYPLSLYQSLATVTFPSDLVLDSVNSTLNSIIYVNGNVEMDDVALSGPLSIIATGNIDDYTTNSTFQTNDPHNGVLLYAAQNITVHSTGNTNTGLLYAPNGTVSLRGTGLTLYGSLVGNQVEVNGGTTVNLSYSPAFASSTYALPLAAMGLIAPATTSVPLPGIPTPSSPTGGTTVTQTNPVLNWNASANAIGYQLQLSTSSSFSSFVTNQSQLSTGERVNNLQNGTAYYWRARAINQAGMSNWSTVASFTVNTPPPPSNPITNGGFEAGDFSGWIRTGTSSISSTAHAGIFAALLGAVSATNGDSTIAQSFSVPNGKNTISFYYRISCRGMVFNDWATATLKDTGTGMTTTILPKTCSNNSMWMKTTTGVFAGHSYILTLVSHDDNSPSTPTNTLYDDVSVN